MITGIMRPFEFIALSGWPYAAGIAIAPPTPLDELTPLLADVDLVNAPYLEAKAGEFYIFHSWILHGSAPNRSPSA